MGLLEVLEDATLLAFEDPSGRDADGISGRAHRIRSANGATRVGRFGWNGAQPTLEARVIAALHGDLGITSEERPDEPLIAVQRQRVAGTALVERGRADFIEAGCVDFDRLALSTGSSSPIAGLRAAVIEPHTDLVLHDKRHGLADHRRDGVFSGREWRAPSSWEIGLLEMVNGRMHFLHDGRATTLAEAILWQGGEGQASRGAFVHMDCATCEALPTILQSL